MAYPVVSIANQIMAYGAAAPDAGELFSNMKLQKLLYYVQGFHIAVFNRPLFNEDIEAWMYGPVVPAVYEYYQENGNKGIMPNEKPITLEAEEESLFNEVLRIYGNYSAIGLMNFTHNEMPWQSTPTGKGHIITKEKLGEFFHTRLA